MPYRTATPVRVYALRSSRGAVVVAVLLSLLALIALVTVGASLGALGPGFFTADIGRLPLLLCLAALILTPVASWYGLKNDQVAGGSGELQLFERSVLVPPPFSGAPIAFSFDGLELDIQRFESRFMFQTVSAVEVLRFRGGGKVRSLTSRLFDSPERLRELVRDIEALSEGAPLPVPGRSRSISASDADRDPYDDQLDAELENFLDD